MVKVDIRNNAGPVAKEPQPHTMTLRQIFEKYDVDYARGMTTLDGTTIQAGELDKTLADFGYDGTDGHNKCCLYNIAKTDNA